jgi:hypothetical protein
MMLDEISLLLLECYCSSSALILLKVFPAQVATVEPQASSGLLATGSDMAKVLAVVALRKASSSSV